MVLLDDTRCPCRGKSANSSANTRNHEQQKICKTHVAEVIFELSLVLECDGVVAQGLVVGVGGASGRQSTSTLGKQNMSRERHSESQGSTC